MPDTITKSVAARLPMDKYVEIITKAAALKMTVSDYLIMKLCGPSDYGPSQTEFTNLQNILTAERQQWNYERKIAAAQADLLKQEQDEINRLKQSLAEEKAKSEEASGRNVA